MKKKKDFKLGVLTQKRTIKQYPKFFACGVAGVVLNLIIFYMLIEFFGVYYLVSAIIAFVLSSSCNFILNKTWTFKEEIEDEFFKKYFKFGIVRLVVLGISLIVLYLFVEYLGIHYMISQAISLIVISLISFLAYKIWIFETYSVG